jgi:hypothetical protein
MSDTGLKSAQSDFMSDIRLNFSLYQNLNIENFIFFFWCLESIYCCNSTVSGCDGGNQTWRFSILGYNRHPTKPQPSPTEVHFYVHVYFRVDVRDKFHSMSMLP